MSTTATEWQGNVAFVKAAFTSLDIAALIFKYQRWHVELKDRQV